MPLPRREIIVPPWRELASGLLVPSSVADRITVARRPEVDLPPELARRPAPVAVVEQLPSSADQMGGALTERELGLPATDLPQLIAKIEPLPFETTFLFTARLAAALWHMRTDAVSQLSIVRQFDMPNLFERIERALRAHDRATTVVFAEQFLTVLQRLLIQHARDAMLAEAATDDEFRQAVAAYFGATSVATSADAHLVDGDPTAEEWLVYIIKNSSYNVRTPHLNAFTRAHELFVTLPPRLACDVHHCPIDDWFREDYGLDAAEQVAVGFAIATVTEALDADAGALERRLILSPIAEGALADRVEATAELVSAPREWFAERFAEVGDGLDEIAWDRTPFLRRPCLRLGSGQWLLISPTAIDSWLGEGFYHRGLECAQRRGERETSDYLTFFGKLLETYCLELAQSVYPDVRPVGGGRVYGEQRYGPRGSKRTSDVTVDLGLDLVVIEVVSARFPRELRVFGKPDALNNALERMLFKKMGQLGRVIRAILSGDARIPDVDPATVERVWPIVVAGGEFIQTELLWDRIDAEVPVDLTAARVQPVTILDVDDFELLLGLVHEGHHLPDVLSQKARGPYRRLDLSRWMIEELHLPQPLLQRPPIIEERWEALGGTMRRILFPDASA